MIRARLFRIVAAAVLAPAVPIAGYAAAGWIGGLLPAHADWRPPQQGVRVYVISNGIHVALVVPKVAAGVDWRGRARAADLRDPRYAGYDHVAIGWGERAFFLETQTWADVRPATILHAAWGSDRTLIHLEHEPRPTAGDGARSLLLRPAEYRRLAAYIQASFAAEAKVLPGYGANDAFYTARGRYSGLRTCNSWIGDALRFAGVRIGRWTPFPATVMRWFPAAAARGDQDPAR